MRKKLLYDVIIYKKKHNWILHRKAEKTILSPIFNVTRMLNNKDCVVFTIYVLMIIFIIRNYVE